MLRNSVNLLTSLYLGLFLIAVFLDFDESLDFRAEREMTPMAPQIPKIKIFII